MGADVAGIAYRKRMHGGSPSEVVDHLPGGGLLPRDAVRIDRIDQGHIVIRGELENNRERIVEVAVHRNHRGTVGDRLSELPAERSCRPEGSRCR